MSGATEAIGTLGDLLDFAAGSAWFDEHKPRLEKMLDAFEDLLSGSSAPAPVEPPIGSYADYLNSPEWQARRRETLVRDGFKCLSCGARARLHIHHLTYVRRGQEHPDDLVTLCDPCHAAWHGKPQP